MDDCFEVRERRLHHASLLTANDAIKGGFEYHKHDQGGWLTGSHFVFFVNGVTVGDLVSIQRFQFWQGWALSPVAQTIDCAFTDLVITRPD